MPDTYSQEDLEQYITAIVDGDTEILKQFEKERENNDNVGRCALGTG